jgi:hypothetical protein
VSLAIANLQVDVPADAFDATVAFWAGALSATPRTSPDGFVHLDGATSAVGVHLQRLDDGPAGYHLDLEADDVEAEVARLVELGAEVVGEPGGWVTLRGPAGLRFCVVAGDRPFERLAPRRPDRAYLDAIFIDVPPTEVELATAFWSAALGASVSPPPLPDHPYTYLKDLPDDAERYLAVQRVGAEARFHVDATVDDVPAEVARLRALGARRVAEVETWVTLADPAGNLLCVVPPGVQDHVFPHPRPEPDPTPTEERR